MESLSLNIRSRSYDVMPHLSFFNAGCTWIYWWTLNSCREALFQLTTGLTARSVHYCALDIILYYLLIIVKITYIIQDQLWLAYGVLSAWSPVTTRAQMCSGKLKMVPTCCYCCTSSAFLSLQMIYPIQSNTILNRSTCLVFIAHAETPTTTEDESSTIKSSIINQSKSNVDNWAKELQP